MLDRLPRGLSIAVFLTCVTVLSFTHGAHGARGTSTPPAAARQPTSLTMVPSTGVETASRSRAGSAVGSFHGVVSPDLLIELPRALTPAQLGALKGIRAMQAVTVVTVGPVAVDGHPFSAMGVEPSSFRAFTPRESASSDALWAAVARGEAASSYAAKLPLSRQVVANGWQLRVGALASFGLPGSDLVVSKDVAASLGAHRNAVLVAAPDRKLRGLKRDVRRVLGDSVDVQVLRPVAITYRRPTSYKDLYVLSAQYCPGLSWKVLAAIGQVESGHGRNVGPSTAGALGPMQFLPSTWASAGVDGDGDGKADIMSPYDAVPAAALYLCRNGAGRGGQGLYDAIFSYNHADWYVRKVLDLAARY